MIGYSFAVSFSLILGLYFSQSIKNNKNVLILFCFYWWLLLSLQYNVGTDYVSYINAFNDNQLSWIYYLKREYLFYYICDFIQKMDLSPQTGFFLVYAFLFLGIYKFIRLTGMDNFSGIYIFVCCSTFLYNATNVVRQYTAIPFLCISVLCLVKSDYKHVLLSILIAVLFHNSIIYCVPIGISFWLFTKYIKNKKVYFIILLIAFVFAISNPIKIFQPLIIKTVYADYLYSEFMKNKISLVNLLTKCIFLPIYIGAIFLEIPSGKKEYLNLGVLAYCLKISVVQMTVFNRAGNSFELLSLIPLYYYYKYNKLNKRLKLLLLCFYLFAGFGLLFFRFFIATINESHEFFYKSILSI